MKLDKVRIRCNTIITHKYNALEFGDFDENLIEDCLLLSDNPDFWSSPLTWVAIKILKRNYYNFYDGSEQSITEDET